jgi:hypothetical protein
MPYIRHAGLCAIAASFLLLGGCAGDSEYARQISRDQAKDECRKLKDASAYLECMKRADGMYGPR